MVLSAIDLGTNTILMVTADVGSQQGVMIRSDDHAVARLGKGVDENGVILPDTFDRVCAFLLGYRRKAESLGAEHITCYSTSALRDAANRDLFIHEMKKRTGIDIQVISGETEARMTYSGALFGLDVQTALIGVIDIGGGSTEIAIGNGSTVMDSVSLDIGAVRITERFLHNQPPTAAQLEQARDYIRQTVHNCFTIPRGTTMVGVAGTITTLGAISAALEQFDAEELNGVRLGAESIQQQTERLATLTHQQIVGIPQIQEGRADVITGGALILDEFMKHTGLTELVVSTRGVRYGMLLDAAQKYVPKANAMNLAS